MVKVLLSMLMKHINRTDFLRLTKPSKSIGSFLLLCLLLLAFAPSKPHSHLTLLSQIPDYPHAISESVITTPHVTTSFEGIRDVKVVVSSEDHEGDDDHAVETPIIQGVHKLSKGQSVYGFSIPDFQRSKLYILFCSLRIFLS